MNYTTYRSYRRILNLGLAVLGLVLIILKIIFQIILIGIYSLQLFKIL